LSGFTTRVTLTPIKRWLITLVLLGSLLLWLDLGKVADQVQSLAPEWLALALLVSIAQTVLSAWRWRFTAARLGLELAPARALSEYYLATFINQVLPGGVLGDAWRAQRHARRSGETGIAWRAVILERASGQIVVVGLALAVLAGFGPWARPDGGWLVLGLALVLVLGGVFWAARRVHHGWPAWIRPFLTDARRALLKADVWPIQLISSLLIVLSYLLVFAAGARGLGVTLSLWQLMVMALPVLLAMLIPISVAGWGVREGAAGLVWIAVGLPPEQGVAASLAYGVLVLLGSLPGALMLTQPNSAQTHINQ
jgi:uncharacterized membrane protein YbhN (UPF0104 family)